MQRLVRVSGWCIYTPNGTCMQCMYPLHYMHESKVITGEGKVPKLCWWELRIDEVCGLWIFVFKVVGFHFHIHTCVDTFLMHIDLLWYRNWDSLLMRILSSFPIFFTMLVKLKFLFSTSQLLFCFTFFSSLFLRTYFLYYVILLLLYMFCLFIAKIIDLYYCIIKRFN